MFSVEVFGMNGSHFFSSELQCPVKCIVYVQHKGFYVTFVLTVLLHVENSAQVLLEKVVKVTRLTTTWPSLSKAEKALNHLTPAWKQFQLEWESRHETFVRDSCQKHWNLEEKYWWPDSFEPCESCPGFLCSVPSAWCRFPSGFGWIPPRRKCQTVPGSGAGSKYSVVSGPHHQNCFQKCHWAINSCIPVFGI